MIEKHTVAIMLLQPLSMDIKLFVQFCCTSWISGKCLDKCPELLTFLESWKRL